MSVSGITAQLDSFRILRDIENAVEVDENLSMLPDDFKNAAITIMYEEAMARSGLNETQKSNKRQCVEMDMYED